MNKDPIAQFQEWFAEAKNAGLLSPETMVLATATRRGVPSARLMLLKGVSRGAFVFYTNYESRKGVELIGNPRAALVFYWERLYRQVRVEGKIKRASRAESDSYFASRDRGSQIGAWASRQSREIAGREELEGRMRLFEEKFRDRPVPRPPHWGGIRLVPERIEFWIGREYRLHDRFCYERKRGGWKIRRLSP